MDPIPLWSKNNFSPVFNSLTQFPIQSRKKKQVFQSVLHWNFFFFLDIKLESQKLLLGKVSQFYEEVQMWPRSISFLRNSRQNKTFPLKLSRFIRDFKHLPFSQHRLSCTFYITYFIYSSTLSRTQCILSRSRVSIHWRICRCSFGYTLF